MSFPSLTPRSTNSARVLPSTGSSGDVATSLAIGYYTGSTAFINGAVAQVAYTYKRLGGDVLDIELTADNVYNHYEEAVLEYSYIVNLHQARNSLGSALGGTTGSFEHRGTISETNSKSLKYPKFKFDYVFEIADKFSTEATVGGTETLYSASFDRQSNQQDYDLQNIVSASAAAGQLPASLTLGGNRRIKIRQLYYVTPRQMWRFYGYYGGLNVVGDFHNYGQYADDSTFQVIPTWQNKIQAVSYEDHLYTRTSHYSYEINNNKLRIYPTPDSVSPEKFWFRFTVDDSDAYSSGSYSPSKRDGINNMNTLPFSNLPFNKINSMGQQWIRRFSLALSKETLGQIRGKFGGSVPIPGDNVTLNASDLLSQASTEQTGLREELNKQLDEMLYSKLAETDKAMIDNTDAIVAKAPLKIYVG
tara:strand:- start:917 stop:2170 length:1254 start_codon:yes stop_codon:yes gene_type:complete